jgi:hypothetical protein
VLTFQGGRGPSHSLPELRAHLHFQIKLRRPFSARNGILARVNAIKHTFALTGDILVSLSLFKHIGDLLR